MEILLPSEPHQEDQLSGPHLLNNPGAQVMAEGTQTSFLESWLGWGWLLRLTSLMDSQANSI